MKPGDVGWTDADMDLLMRSEERVKVLLIDVLETLQRVTAERDEARAELDEAQLSSIEGWNPGIDMAKVRADRANRAHPETWTEDQR